MIDLNRLFNKTLRAFNDNREKSKSRGWVITFPADYDAEKIVSAVLREAHGRGHNAEANFGQRTVTVYAGGEVIKGI